MLKFYSKKIYLHKLYCILDIILGRKISTIFCWNLSQIKSRSLKPEIDSRRYEDKINTLQCVEDAQLSPRKENFI